MILHSGSKLMVPKLRDVEVTFLVQRKTEDLHQEVWCCVLRFESWPAGDPYGGVSLEGVKDNGSTGKVEAVPLVVVLGPVGPGPHGHDGVLVGLPQAVLLLWVFSHL